MLNANDIAWIKNNRKEITQGRQRPITLAYEGAGMPDPITGEVTGGETITREVMSVVTEISSTTGQGIERIIVGGIEAQRGDLWLSVPFDDIADIADKFDRLRYDGAWYAVLASDKKGIGIRNRVEVLGRLIT